ncbi:hypothetical protein Tco_0605173, partial [Tanacetum coccineum]
RSCIASGDSLVNGKGLGGDGINGGIVVTGGVVVVGFVKLVVGARNVEVGVEIGFMEEFGVE